MNFYRKFNNKVIIYDKSSFLDFYVFHLNKILTAT